MKPGGCNHDDVGDDHVDDKYDVWISSEMQCKCVHLVFNF